MKVSKYCQFVILERLSIICENQHGKQVLICSCKSALSAWKLCRLLNLAIEGNIDEKLFKQIIKIE
jgi:hypothetical protein